MGSGFAVVGAGALGRWLSATLASVGADVKLVTRPGTDTGQTVCRIEGSATLMEEVPSGPADGFVAASCRWLLLCTKAADLEVAAREAASLLAPGGAMVVLSNGLGHAETLRGLGLHRCVAATVTYGLLASPDGSVQRRGDGGEVAIGPLTCASSGLPAEDMATVEEAHELARCLGDAGLRVRVVEDGAGLVWHKAMLNAGLNPVAALLGCENGVLPEHPAFGLSIEAAREVLEVAASAGVELAVDPEQALRGLCRDTATNRCSTLQDLDAGRQTEMDWICGAVVRLAEQEAGSAPVNRFLGALVQNAETART